jgi:hypothetical protein
MIKNKKATVFYIALVLFIIWVFTPMETPTARYACVLMAAVMFVVSWCLALIVFRLLTRKIAAKSFTANNGEILKVFGSETYIWKHQYKKYVDPFDDKHLYSYELEWVVVEPRTETLFITICILKAETPKATLEFEILKEELRPCGLSDLKTMTEWFGNEFIKKHRSQLTEFYNPNDQEQQRAFQQLLLHYFYEKFPNEALLVSVESQFGFEPSLTYKRYVEDQTPYYMKPYV